MIIAAKMVDLPAMSNGAKAEQNESKIAATKPAAYKRTDGQSTRSQRLFVPAKPLTAQGICKPVPQKPDETIPPLKIIAIDKFLIGK
jgi:hypothetical protein